MSRQSASNPNPYKEPSTFFDTFSKDSPPTDKNLQTAQFRSPSELDKAQTVILLMSAEFERLHGIIQALALRYKDLESRHETKERETAELKFKIQGFGDSSEKVSALNSELERSKGQVSELILQVEDLKGKLIDKENEIMGLKAKGQTVIPPISSYTVKTEGGYPLYGEKVEEVKKAGFAYSSEPRPDHDVKNYDYYSKLYDPPKEIKTSQQEFYYSPEKLQYDNIGLHNSGDFEYKDYKPQFGDSDYKAPSGGHNYYMGEEDYSKKYGVDYNKLGEDDYSKKYGLDYNKGSIGTNLSMSRELESNREPNSAQKGTNNGDFDYKKGYQFQYYDEGHKF